MLAYCSFLRNILGLSLPSRGELFILETGRSVVRLARAEDDLGPASDWSRGEALWSMAQVPVHHQEPQD